MFDARGELNKAYKAQRALAVALNYYTKTRQF